MAGNPLCRLVSTRGLSVGVRGAAEGVGDGMRQYLAYGHKTRANGVKIGRVYLLYVSGAQGAWR